MTGIARLPLLQVLCFLPVTASIPTIPAFYGLAGSLLRSRVQAALSVLAFALLPRSFIWLIMGGGLTRSFGLLFAILMLQQTYLLYTLHRTRFVFSTILFAALTVLSHPAGAWFAAFSAALLFLFYGRNRVGLIRSVWVVAGVLLLTATWWVTVVARFGPSPLLAASETGGYAWYSWIRLVTFDFSEESFLGLLATIGLVGALFCVARRRLWLPVWLAAILILDPRSGATYAMLPLAMLAAIGIMGVVLPAVSSSTGTAVTGVPVQEEGLDDRLTVLRLHGWFPRLVLAFVLLHALVSALMVGSMHPSALEVLPAEDQAAMEWVAANTDPASRFVLVTAALAWASDNTSEWFPALAQRVSVATVQDYEWLPKSQFHQQVERFAELQACAAQDEPCFESWVRQNGPSFENVYVHEAQVWISPGKVLPCPVRLRNSLLVSKDYRLVYDRPGVAVFERLGGDQRAK